MKRRIIMLLLCLTMLAGAGCVAPSAGKSSEAQSLTIAVASDLHYLSASLTDNGPLFRKIAANGDGKLILDIETVTEAFVEQMIAERPDLLILSGDLSLNGERQSHEDLAAKLRRIEDAGVTVLVLPGNHDLNSSRAACYRGEDYELVDSVSAEQFRSIYADFGYDEALSADDLSASYSFAPCQGLRLILLDTNSKQSNTFPQESMSWLKKQLKEAKRDGAQVITVSHQNLMVHNGLFIFGYQIMNADELKDLLVSYGVPLHLSGHMHIQHALTDGLTEILTSPLSMTPCRYGMLRWDGESLVYEVRSVDVADWAASKGLMDENLLSFDKYARDFFWQTAYDKIFTGCLASGLDAETAGRMANCFADTNLAYFTGEAVDRAWLAREIDFWAETAGKGFETAYLRSILEDEAPSPLKIEIHLGRGT